MMKAGKICKFIVLICAISALLGGCRSDYGEVETYFGNMYSDPLTYDTEIEYYKALFQADKGTFLSSFVADDLTLRFICSQFFEQIELMEVEQPTDGIYIVNKMYRVTLATDGRVITKFKIRKDGA